jgi:hypothetical protein
MSPESRYNTDFGVGEKNDRTEVYITCENIVESGLHVGGVQGGGLNEAEVVLLSKRLVAHQGNSYPLYENPANHDKRNKWIGKKKIP